MLVHSTEAVAEDYTRLDFNIIMCCEANSSL